VTRRLSEGILWPTVHCSLLIFPLEPFNCYSRWSKIFSCLSVTKGSVFIVIRKGSTLLSQSNNQVHTSTNDVCKYIFRINALFRNAVFSFAAIRYPISTTVISRIS
jgi:hypothetical protein